MGILKHGHYDASRRAQHGMGGQDTISCSNSLNRDDDDVRGEESGVEDSTHECPTS